MYANDLSFPRNWVQLPEVTVSRISVGPFGIGKGILTPSDALSLMTCSSFAEAPRSYAASRLGHSVMLDKMIQASDVAYWWLAGL